jgi:hypothetical protein
LNAFNAAIFRIYKQKFCHSLIFPHRAQNQHSQNHSALIVIAAQIIGQTIFGYNTKYILGTRQKHPNKYLNAQQTLMLSHVLDYTHSGRKLKIVIRKKPILCHYSQTFCDQGADLFKMAARPYAKLRLNTILYLLWVL